MVKHDTTLTFHGGVSEIGGNKISLRDRDSKVFDRAGGFEFDFEASLLSLRSGTLFGCSLS